MAIIKNKIKENFTVIPNEVLTNQTLKDGDYRLLLHLYRLPNDWEVNQEQLGTEFKISREQINRRITNLKQAGFLEITKIKVGQERWKYNYTLIIPSVTNMSQQQMSHHEMSQQQMSQSTNTEYTLNTKDINNTNNIYVFKKPTIDEIESYCKERNNNVNANRFYDFYESKGWMVGKNKMKDWKASIRTWEKEIKKDNTPEWFDKEIKIEQLNKNELEDLEREMSEFK